MTNKEGETPPFFMEKIAQEKRAQFRVIEGSGNNYNSIDSRMSFLMGRVYLEDAILGFFDYVGLNHEDINEANPDPTYIKNTFNNFIADVAHGEEDPYKNALLRGLSLEKVADMCEQKLKAAVYTFSETSNENQVENNPYAFNVAGYWRKTRIIILESINAPQKKLQLVPKSEDLQ